MKFSILLAGVATLLLSCGNTKKMKNDGWTNLLEGNSLKGWNTYNKPGSMGSAWMVNDGVLYFSAERKKLDGPDSGGDIVFNETFTNFHLQLEWKISPKGNSGIMFFVQESPEYRYPWTTGPEMQILDNDGHADGKIKTHRAGDLYDLISCNRETVKPVGEWNLAEIVANNGQLDFFLNGEKVVSTTLWDDNWKQMLAKSKFKAMPAFGQFKSGKIALQDHGDDVWFRNIRVKRL